MSDAIDISLFGTIVGLPVLGQVAIDNWMEYRAYEEHEDDDKDDFFDILDVEYSRDELVMGLRMLIQYPHNTNNSFDSLVHIYLGFDKDNYSIRAGTFYQVFGSGMLLNSFEQKSATVGRSELSTYVDRRINGVKLGYNHDLFDLVLLSGEMLNKTIRGAQAQVHPWYYLTLGSAFLAGYKTETYGFETVQDDNELSSIFLRTSLGDAFDWDNIYWGIEAELARIYPYVGSEDKDGRGFFAASGFNAGPVSLSLQYKKYDRMDFVTGTGPIALNTPYYALLNRVQHQANYTDEEGGLAEISYSFSPEKQVTFAWSQSDNTEKDIFHTYREAFTEFTWVFADFWKTRIAYDYARDAYESAERRDTYMTENELYLTDTYTLLLGYEYQETVDMFEEANVIINRFFELSLLSSPLWAITLLSESSNKVPDPSSKDTQWNGLALTTHLSENHDLSLFYGKRRGGLVCAGGLCTLVPPFSGLELRLTSSF